MLLHLFYVPELCILTQLFKDSYYIVSCYVLKVRVHFQTVHKKLKPLDDTENTVPLKSLYLKSIAWTKK